MPKILEKHVKRLVKEGKDKSSAYVIATSYLQKAGKLKKSKSITDALRRG